MTWKARAQSYHWITGRKNERMDEGTDASLVRHRSTHKKTENKAVYTITDVASGWAGAGVVMPKNAKKARCDGRMDGGTDRPTRCLIGRVSCDKN